MTKVLHYNFFNPRGFLGIASIVSKVCSSPIVGMSNFICILGRWTSPRVVSFD